MVLSRYQALKSTIIIKLSYALEKKSFILVKSPRNLESESAKCGLHIDLTNQFPLLRLGSKGKVQILKWNFGKESWQDGIAA